MRKYLTIEDNFVKVEFCDFWSRKPLTMLKHLEVFVEQKTGLKRGTIATFDEYFIKHVATTNSMGDIHYEEKWEDTRGLQLDQIDYENDPPPEKLAWVLDMTCQDGIYTYGYLGFSIAPGFGFSFQQGLKNPKAIKQRPYKASEEKEDDDFENKGGEVDGDAETGNTEETRDGAEKQKEEGKDEVVVEADKPAVEGEEEPKKKRRTRQKSALVPTLPPDEIEKALDDLSKMIETNSILMP